jgi:predicted lipoprotein with Yx(FWY)xxD motif
MASSRVRTNGSLQWTYGGKPLYLYSGDMTGDGFGGVWNVVSQ